MLVRFNVGNFLSFKEIQEFSLIKGKVKNKSDRLYDNGKIKLLKFSSIFGANASGKSNLVKAIKYAQATILKGKINNRHISSFKLDQSYKNKNSYFEFEIVINNKNYSYGFEMNIHKKQFVSEWLIELYSNNSEKNIFTRDILNGQFKSDLLIKTAGLKTKFDVYSDDLKNNKDILFINEMNNRAKSELYKSKNELSIFKDVYNWFAEKLDVNYPDRPISDYSYFRDSNNKEDICRVIKGFGTGISNFQIKHSSLEQVSDKLPKKLLSQLQNDLEELKHLRDIRDIRDKNKHLSTITIRANEMYFMITLDETNQIDVTTIVFNHGNNVEFDFNEESDGTRRILDLIEILFASDEKIYVIDELDRSLHPQLTYKFVEEFLKQANKKNIQLIITTHEARLLDFGLVRQDEIWLSNKNIKGETELYSLDEYNVRFDQKIEKAYLEGRYGGVPIFSSIFPIKKED
ncbi:AAA family ATPase [Clostridium ganghwense]|uniref:ATP/GTP-binding protein n=1 Tax=Clostridium ganghwense TaxID=312089 RepID=A0ABT4CQ87_9CLOT|nr:ATP/GTP-binding protein [Clostridium ganghwense]MCY6371226.1 ATP/GTP-binding protein [Clostridium ganghwense]